MEYITQDIIAYLVEDKGIEISAAMMLFYSSAMYEKLMDEGTGLYLEGSGYVYGLFKDELKDGRIIQREQ